MKTFTNELGNQITIEVVQKPMDNTEGILITLEGPTSTSENHITRTEAKILLEELKDALT